MHGICFSDTITKRPTLERYEQEENIMPLVSTKEMFEKAYKGGYAIGAFNVNNMEIVQGITQAAMEVIS